MPLHVIPRHLSWMYAWRYPQISHTATGNKIIRAKSTEKRHPLILGTDWSGVLKCRDRVGICLQSLAVCSICTAHSCDTRSSITDSGEQETAGPSCKAPLAQVIDRTKHFRLVQSHDDTL